MLTFIEIICASTYRTSHLVSIELVSLSSLHYPLSYAPI